MELLGLILAASKKKQLLSSKERYRSMGTIHVREEAEEKKHKISHRQKTWKGKTRGECNDARYQTRVKSRVKGF